MVRFSSLWIVAVWLAYSLSACKEIGPEINLKNNENIAFDTTYVESPVAAAETKNVLMEEFTGVRCPNCPQGHAIIEDIKNQHPGRVVAMSIHPINSLGTPYSFSVMDFRTQEGHSLYEYLVPINQEPVAGIDRRLFGGEGYILLDKVKWTGYVSQQVTEAARVNVGITPTYNSTTRELTIVSELHFTQATTQPTRITIALTESNMITAQLNGSVIDTFYSHKDVMRRFVTATLGDPVHDAAEAGRVVRRVYKTTLDEAWKPENMHVVAYVHEFQNTKAVYQAKEVAVQ